MKKDQIEKMAKEYYGYSIDSEADCKFVAEEMYNKGHRKLPEDSVVLSREELSKEPYNDFCKGCPNVRVRSSGITDCCADYSCEQFQKYARLIELYKQSRNETAEKILDLLVPDCKACDENWHSGCLCLRATLAEKIAKQFGVEVQDDGTRTN